MQRLQRLQRRIFRFDLRDWLPYCLVVCLAMGCSSVPDNPDNGGGGGGGDVVVTARINSILANAGLSVDDPAIAIFYTVTGTPDSIRAVFVAVEDSSPNAMETGTRLSLAQNLPASGADAFFQFFPAGPGAGVGFYRVGIEVTTDGDTIEAFSDAVIQVQGGPDPCFTQPCTVADAGAAAGVTYSACGGLVCDLITEVTVGETAALNIVFDAGDPEGDVRWRLFYLGANESCSNPSTGLGTEILTGSGNVASVAFLTLDLPDGDFEIGVSATDSGMSVADTVDFDGNDDRIVTVCGPVVRVVP